MRRQLTIGISPCPNDTYIFHALLHGLARRELAEDIGIEYILADVEKLNSAAMRRAYPFSKISVGVVPAIFEDYALLSAGAALGWGCGPLLVARNNNFDPAKAAIAIPGANTTANLLLDMTGEFAGPRQELLFSEIIPAVARGDFELGVIIHEGRFTYQEHGLVKILDLGQWWESKFHLPLPLGAIAARRDQPLELVKAMEKSIAASIDYARLNPGASRDFISQNAQELSEDVTRAHIETFVTDYSRDLGEAGREAMRRLVEAALALRGKKLDHNLFLE